MTARDAREHSGTMESGGYKDTERVGEITYDKWSEKKARTNISRHYCSIQDRKRGDEDSFIFVRSGLFL